MCPAPTAAEARLVHPSLVSCSSLLCHVCASYVPRQKNTSGAVLCLENTSRRRAPRPSFGLRRPGRLGGGGAGRPRLTYPPVSARRAVGHTGREGITDQTARRILTLPVRILRHTGMVTGSQKSSVAARGRAESEGTYRDRRDQSGCRRAPTGQAAPPAAAAPTQAPALEQPRQ